MGQPNEELKAEMQRKLEDMFTAIATSLQLPLEEQHGRTAGLLGKVIERVEALERGGDVPEIVGMRVRVDRLGSDVTRYESVLRDWVATVDKLEGRIAALEGKATTRPLRNGPPPGVPALPSLDPTTDGIADAVTRRERDRNELNKCTIQSDSIAQALGIPLGSREQNTERSLQVITSIIGERDSIARQNARLNEQIREARELAKVAEREAIHHREEASALLHDRNTAREALAKLETTCAQQAEQLTRQAILLKQHEQAEEFLETQRANAANALELANTEWNALRRIVNTVIEPEFEGQTLTDAIVNTVQLLKSRIAAAAPNAERQDELRRDLDVACEESANARAAAERLRQQRQGHLSTIADQARQIAELREELAERQSKNARASGKHLDQIAEVWEQIAHRDEFGTPFWSESGLDDTTPGQAVAIVLEHLRNKIKATDQGREYALKGCDDLNVQLTKLHRQHKQDIDELQAQLARSSTEAANARERMHAAEVAATQHASRARDLEGQLERRGKLDAMRLHETDALRMAIVTVADERFGPFPVMSADDALTAIQRGIFFQSLAIENGRKLFERVQSWGTATVTDDLLVDAVRVYSEAETARREQIEAWERHFIAAISGASTDPVDDCQAGTCDCPKLALDNGGTATAHAAPADPPPNAGT